MSAQDDSLPSSPHEEFKLISPADILVCDELLNGFGIQVAVWLVCTFQARDRKAPPKSDESFAFLIAIKSAAHALSNKPNFIMFYLHSIFDLN